MAGPNLLSNNVDKKCTYHLKRHAAAPISTISLTLFGIFRIPGKHVYAFCEKKCRSVVRSIIRLCQEKIKYTGYWV